jgi:hypothetical protein
MKYVLINIIYKMKKLNLILSLSMAYGLINLSSLNASTTNSSDIAYEEKKPSYVSSDSDSDSDNELVTDDFLENLSKISEKIDSIEKILKECNIFSSFMINFIEDKDNFRKKNGADDILFYDKIISPFASSIGSKNFLEMCNSSLENFLKSESKVLQEKFHDKEKLKNIFNKEIKELYTIKNKWKIFHNQAFLIKIINKGNKDLNDIFSSTLNSELKDLLLLCLKIFENSIDIYEDLLSRKDGFERVESYDLDNDCMYAHSYPNFFDAKKRRDIIDLNMSIISLIDNLSKKNNININNLYPAGFKEIFIDKKMIFSKKNKNGKKNKKIIKLNFNHPEKFNKNIILYRHFSFLLKKCNKETNLTQNIQYTSSEIGKLFFSMKKRFEEEFEKNSFFLINKDRFNKYFDKKKIQKHHEEIEKAVKKFEKKEKYFYDEKNIISNEEHFSDLKKEIEKIMNDTLSIKENDIKKIISQKILEEDEFSEEENTLNTETTSSNIIVKLEKKPKKSKYQENIEKAIKNTKNFLDNFSFEDFEKEKLKRQAHILKIQKKIDFVNKNYKYSIKGIRNFKYISGILEKKPSFQDNDRFDDICRAIEAMSNVKLISLGKGDNRKLICTISWDDMKKNIEQKNIKKIYKEFKECATVLDKKECINVCQSTYYPKNSTATLGVIKDVQNFFQKIGLTSENLKLIKE